LTVGWDVGLRVEKGSSLSKVRKVPFILGFVASYLRQSKLNSVYV